MSTLSEADVFIFVTQLGLIIFAARLCGEFAKRLNLPLLVGEVVAGILLGPWVGIALTGLSLLLQAAFFAHGGFSTWGANVITLDEALANADSANNLQWLISNTEAASDTPKADDKPAVGEQTIAPGGASFSEFTLKL